MAQHEEASRFLSMIQEAAANNARGERLLQSKQEEKAALESKLRQILTEYESKKAERHKAEEEHKTLTAQLLSIQATVSTKKARINVQQEELNVLRDLTSRFEEESDRFRAGFTSKMLELSESIRRLHEENRELRLREELRSKEENYAALKDKLDLHKNAVQHPEDDKLTLARAELATLNIKLQEVEAHTQGRKKDLAAKEASKRNTVKQLNQVNKEHFQKQQRFEQLQQLSRDYAELEELQRESCLVQEAFTAAHSEFQKRSACPKCGANAYAKGEVDEARLQEK